MSVSRDELVRLAVEVITSSLGIQQPFAGGLAEQVATHLINKAIAPTVENISNSLTQIMSEQSFNQEDVITPEEIFEKLNMNSAKTVGIKVAESHVDLFMQIRSEFIAGSDVALLSTNVSNLSNIPEQIRQQIAEIQTKFLKIINAVAINIEEKKSKSVEQAILDMQSTQQISGSQREKMQLLVDADKEFRISCQSLRVTVDFFSALNDHIVKELEKLEGGDQEFRLVVGNAVLIYELADFVIKYLESFKLQGISDITGIKSEIDRMIQAARENNQELKEEAQKEGIFPEFRDVTLAEISQDEEAFQIIVDEWNDYLKQIKALSDETNDFISQWLPNLKLIRNKAKNRLSILEIMAVVRVLKINLTALETSVAKLGSMRLIPLSPDRVRRLFKTN